MFLFRIIGACDNLPWHPFLIGNQMTNMMRKSVCFKIKIFTQTIVVRHICRRPTYENIKRVFFSSRKSDQAFSLFIFIAFNKVFRRLNGASTILINTFAVSLEMHGLAIVILFKVCSKIRPIFHSCNNTEYRLEITRVLNSHQTCIKYYTTGYCFDLLLLLFFYLRRQFFKHTFIIVVNL